VTSAKSLGAWNNYDRERDFANEPFTINGSRPFKVNIGDRTFECLSDDRTLIRFSAPFTENFETDDGNSGSFNIDKELGSCRGFDKFEGRLLIICDYGFATLDVTYSSEQFRVQTIARLSGFLMPESACVLGRDIYFATEQGICRLLRGQVELLDIPMDANIDTTFQARAIGNCYVLRLRVGHAIVIEALQDSYLYVSSDQTKIWESEEFTLGYSTYCQFLKQIQFRANSDINLIVKSSSREQKITVTKGEGLRRINFNIKGESFKIRIEGDQTTELSDLMVVIGFGRYIWK